MKILLAVDDDRLSMRAALAVADWLPHDAAIVALHIGPPISLSTLPSAGIAAGGLASYPYATLRELDDRSDEQLMDEARQVAARAADIAGGTPRVERGDPVLVIERVADEIDADLIVVGTGDRGWLERLFRPSVGTEVATTASRSVLVIRES